MEMHTRAPQRDRPVGLVVLACIQFFFGAVALLSLGITSEVAGAYGVLSPLLTGAAMVATGIGYLQMRWGLGFVGGNVLALGSLGNILVFNALEGFANLPRHVPSMIYPVVLLALLNLRYKSVFAAEAPAV